MPGFNGLKVCWSGNGLSDYPDIRRVDIAKEPIGSSKKYSDEFSFEPGVVGGGGNSGFQALNLALLFGARRVIMIGFDMQRENPGHWYGRNHWMMAGNPDENNFRRWVAAFNNVAVKVRDIGAEIVNVSPRTAVTAFRRASLAEILNEWT